MYRRFCNWNYIGSSLDDSGVEKVSNDQFPEELKEILDRYHVSIYTLKGQQTSYKGIKLDHPGILAYSLDGLVMTPTVFKNDHKYQQISNEILNKISELNQRGELNVFSQHKSETLKLKTPPASLLLKLAESLPDRYSNDLKQNISDMRIEYYEALQKKNIGKARMIVAEYYICLAFNSLRWVTDKIKLVVGIIPKGD